LGDLSSAIAQYRLAAQSPETFYGQIALARIDATPTLHLNDMQVDASSAKNDFDADELVRVMRVLGDLGQENILRIFALHDQELHPDIKRENSGADDGRSGLSRDRGPAGQDRELRGHAHARLHPPGHPVAAIHGRWRCARSGAPSRLPRGRHPSR